MKNAELFRKKAVTKAIILFLFLKLPLAFLAGVRVKNFDAQGITTRLRFRWINQNPFKSIYFAALHMAAELATGLLLFQYLNKENKFSMLLIQTQATFTRKATGMITFSCTQGPQAEDFVHTVMNSSQGQTIQFTVTAHNEHNEQIAVFDYTWSCKKK